jgi:hypothetical protein
MMRAVHYQVRKPSNRGTSSFCSLQRLSTHLSTQSLDYSISTSYITQFGYCENALAGAVLNKARKLSNSPAPFLFLYTLYLPTYPPINLLDFSQEPEIQLSLNISTMSRALNDTEHRNGQARRQKERPDGKARRQNKPNPTVPTTLSPGSNARRR